MKKQNLIDTLNQHNNLHKIFFGCQGIEIHNGQYLDDAQLGYRYTPEEKSLIGESKKDWKESWYVFANDTELSDPYFTDIEDPDLPVYTAMHGCDTWEPELVSPNITDFLKSLEYLFEVSKDEFSKIDPDNDTVTDEGQITQIEIKLNQLNQNETFWSDFMERHIEWLEDSDDNKINRI